MLTEIAGDASLDKFRAEYEKLHGALVSSHGEKRLVAKCRDLNAEIGERGQGPDRAEAQRRGPPPSPA